MSIDELLSAGRLERVPADRSGAGRRLDAAARRVRDAPGAHAAVAVYAAAEPGVEATAELDRMRRFRNGIEYGSTSFTERQVRHDLAHARAVVEAVGGALDR